MTSTWFAPGRVNLIGEHVDYNGGLVLPIALPLGTTATVTSMTSGRAEASSDQYSDRVMFSAGVQPGEVSGWASYVAGVIWALSTVMAEETLDIPSRVSAIARGLQIEVTTDLPIGAGLSSSAALTCAIAAAINDELDLDLSRAELAAIARRAENDFVGVPTGAMDQIAAMLCEPGHALLLDCRSLSTMQIPFDPAASGCTLLVIDTHTRHELAGSEYAERRTSCEQAATAIGVPSLREATLSDVRALHDPLIQRRARHVVAEIERVRGVVAILDTGQAADIGAYLTASHESLRDDFEVSSAQLDVAVDAAIAAGALGARMTGGGFGGCVIALAREADVDRVQLAVQASYDAQGWTTPTVFAASASEGARRQD